MTNGNDTTTAAAATTTTRTMGDNTATVAEPESSLSVRTNESGLVMAATTLVPVHNVGMTSSVGDIHNTRSAAAVAVAAAAASGTPLSSTGGGAKNVQDGDTTTAAAAASASSSTSLSPALDFITTSNAVKALFSIPYDDSPEPVFLAVHNINGTLLIDEAESEQNYDHQSRADPTVETKASGRNSSSPTRSTTTATPKNLPSSEDLALALSTTHLQTTQQQQSQTLNNVLSTLLNRPFGEGGDGHHGDEEKTNSSSSNNNTGQLAPPIAPREFIEWKFQDFNLMVGSDALIVRPTTTASDDSTTKNASSSGASGEGIAIRVENKDVLQRAWEAFQVRQKQQYHGRDKQLLTDSPSSSSNVRQGEEKEEEEQSCGGHTNTTTKSRVSYAQILKQKPNTTTDKTTSSTSKKISDGDDTEKDGEDKEDEHPRNEQQIMKSGFSELPLQTCIVPHHGRMIGDSQIINDPPVSSSSSSPGHDTPSSSEPSPVSVVLDAYLDNLMANVPQLALCLQEKGLIQSVKLLQTQDIPSRMIHPSTYDAVDFMGSSNPQSVSSAQEDAFFSPQIMDMNATALLRFLKTNCTRNNSTYLLRHEPLVGPLGNGQGHAGLGQRQIQLYDISSISTQGQKKWIWWLATMSHRFALRLRHLETAPSSSSSFSESQKRELRDRQRSLYQQTLDLLQDLKDMDGGNHESMVASVWEHMADTFLGESASTGGMSPVVHQSATASAPKNQTPKGALATTTVQLDVVGPSHTKGDRGGDESVLNDQPYKDVSIDALNKAQDYLLHAIKSLTPSLMNIVEDKDGNEADAEIKTNSSTKRRRKRPGRNVDTVEGKNVTNERDARKPGTGIGASLSPMIIQLFGMNHKLIDVSLGLIDHYLRNYQSSNAMQALRMASRKLADSIHLMETFYESLDNRQGEVNATNLRVQYMRLYESCGHFARSFASDVLWRERGHASGDDVVSVIRDVDIALSQNQTKSNKSSMPHYYWWKTSSMDTLPERSHGLVTLQSLSGVVSRHGDAVYATKEILAKENVLVRDKMKVLVASCISYDRVTSIFRGTDGTDSSPIPVTYSEPSQRLTLHLLGDSCNETGKMFLNTLRNHLVASQGKMEDPAKRQAATGMLDSAQFWFGEGLDAFERCGDVQNRSLLRMNLCQSYKLRANNAFDNSTGKDQTRSPASTNAERSLEDAIGQLEKAHEELGQRDTAPYAWDMVSAELASTFLLLGTRRRQCILGDGGNPLILTLTRRLQPGQEHSIIDPMEKSLQIYTERGNEQQAAAVHYQLALTFSKLWTCQVNETKTRQKLSSAFDHYQKAHAYFFSHLRGNESVFCLLCMDLAKLYSNIPGETTLVKALGCCLDTCDAFSMESIQAAIGEAPTSTQSSEWLEKMATIAQSVDETTFKKLRSLVQLENGGNRYKDIYRAGLTAKMARNVSEGDENDNWLGSDTRVTNLLTLHGVLVALKGIYPSLL